MLNRDIQLEENSMQENSFTQGSILKGMLRFSVPYLITCFLQTFYGMADLFIVGQYNGAASISAVSVGSQLMHMLTVVAAGFAMGSTVLIGRNIGAGNRQGVSRAIGTTFAVFGVFAVILTTMLLFFVHPIIGILAVPAEAVPEASAYMRICFTGVIFITAYNVLSAIFRGIGDTKRPMYYVFAAGVINVGLDWLLVGPLHMGAAGAACATVASQAVSVLLALAALFLVHGDLFAESADMGKRTKNSGAPGSSLRPSDLSAEAAGMGERAKNSGAPGSSLRPSDLSSEAAGMGERAKNSGARSSSLRPSDLSAEAVGMDERVKNSGARGSSLRPSMDDALKILQVGVPVALQEGLIQVSFLVITMIANSRGVDVAAAVGIVEKVISFLFLVPSAMLSTVSALSAQNAGAGANERSRKILRLGCLLCAGFGGAVFILCQPLAPHIVSLFVGSGDGQNVILLGGQYLRTYSMDCMFAGIHFCFSGFFSAYGKSGYSFLHNIISILTLRIPGAWLASILFPTTLYAMGIAAPMGSLLSILICLALYRIGWKNWA